MNQPVLSIQHLTKTFHHRTILDRVSLSVYPGEIYGLVGRNGAGKTTLMRAVTGLTYPDSGQIELFGSHSTSGTIKTHIRLGTMIEEAAFYPYLTAYENLDFYRKIRGIPDRNCIKQALLLVGLSDTGKKKFKHFSLGMKQRLGLAAAIMHKPDLLILDEPINGLDPVGIVEIRELLLKLNREQHVTILISSHILPELSQLASRYGFLHNGHLVHEITRIDLAKACQEYLEISVDDPSAATVCLEQLPESLSYDVLPDGRLRVYQYDHLAPKIAATLTSAGIGIYHMTEKGQTLEDYFLHVIGGGSHDV